MRCRGRSAARRCRSRPARGRSTRDRGTRWPRLRRGHGRPRRVRAGREDPSVAGPTHLIPGPVGATRRSGFAGVTPPASGTRASASERRRDDRGQDPGPEHRAEQARTAVRGRTRGPCRSCPPLAGTTGSGPGRAPVGGAPPTCRARRRAARRRGRRWLDRAVDRVRGGSRRALPGTTRAHATVPRTDKGDARVRACRARGGEADIGAGAGG